MLEIIFDRQPGRIFDLFQSMFMVYNQSAQEAMDQYGLAWNKKFQKAYEDLSRHVDMKKNEGMDLFFHRDVHAIWMFYSSHLSWKTKTIDDFIQTLETFTDEELINKLYRYLYSLKENTQYEDNRTLQDEDEFLHFLESTQMPDALKWNAFNFIRNPEAYMKKLMEVLHGFAAKYNKILDDNSSQIEKFNQTMEVKIKHLGPGFFDTELPGIISTESYGRIYVSTAFMCNYMISVDCESEGDTLYLILGIDYKTVLNQLSGKNDVEHNLNALRIISDPTRFEIITLLLQKTCYGQEIAEKLGLSMATISHHMEQLYIAARVVKADISGHRVYYSLNRDELRKCLDFFRNRFEL